MARFGTTGLVKTRKGAGLAEYGILGGLVSVLAVSAVLAFGEEVQGTFTTVSEAVSSQGESSDNGQAPAPAGPQYGLSWMYYSTVQYFDETNSVGGGNEVHSVYPQGLVPVWLGADEADYDGNVPIDEVWFVMIDFNQNGLVDPEDWATIVSRDPLDLMSSVQTGVMVAAGSPGELVVLSHAPLPAMTGQDPFVALGLIDGQWEPFSIRNSNPAP